MKKLICGVLLLVTMHFEKAYSQSHEAIQLGLNIEKLAQLKSILSNLKKGYEVVFKGYNTVKDISQGNFKIHQVFLDGLMEVSPVVKKYRKVTDIIDYQLRIIKEYKTAFGQLKSSKWFTDGEIKYLGNVYENLFKSSLQNLEELTNIVTAGKLRMSDDERLKGIDQIFKEMEDKLEFLRHFNSQNKILAIQRAKSQTDMNGVKSLYDIK